LTGTIAIFTCCSLVGLAQDGAKTAPKAAAAKEEAKPDAKDGKKGRLPAQYGKLGLTDAQKTKVYGVQGKYEDQLDALEKQISDLKAKRDQEVEAVLTADQRKILKALVESKDDKKPEAKAEPAKDAKK
jgi:Spy/CpxP family protein refolding chaperone